MSVCPLTLAYIAVPASKSVMSYLCEAKEPNSSNALVKHFVVSQQNTAVKTPSSTMHPRFVSRLATTYFEYKKTGRYILEVETSPKSDRETVRYFETARGKSLEC